MPVCTACGQENPDPARFCLSCGTPLAPHAPPSEERKPITAVFCDLVGSTARAEQLDPEDVRALLVPYHSRAKAELERFGGTVEKFIGDAVVGVFGAPLSHEDDPERAVRAALAMKDAVAELNVEDEWLDLHVRIGVNTGEALVIVGARPSEGEGMAAGDVMNTAARIQSAAPVDGVAVGAATFRATTAAFEYRELEPIQAKGKSEPVPVWELIGERAEGPLTVHQTPLVGRARELEQLSSLWDGVLSENRPALATVLGAPGIGKTRLLRAFRERIGSDVALHVGRCLPYGEGITYSPVIEIVKSAADIRQTDTAECVGERLDTLLDSLPTSDPDELRTIATALANLTGAPTTPRGTYAAEELPQAELHWGIRRALQLLARRQPLLLVFEDLHWAEPTLLELLQFLVEPSTEASILLIGSARPELADEPHAVPVTGPGAHVVELHGLTESEGEDLVAGMLGPEAAAAGLPEKLLRKAGGNPLFLEELVGILSDMGALDGEADLETLPVPDSLQALLGSRLDALGREEKLVAQHASVIGAIFWVGAVSHLNGAIDPVRRLAELERRDFVHARAESTVADDLEYAFKHILIRDVAYERLPRGRRAELHVRFAGWLEQLPGAADDFVEILAYHFEQACRLARSVAHSPVAPPVLPAVEALTRSAEKAERSEGVREADRFYARALELVGEEHLEPAIELQLGRGRMLVTLGELSKARRQLLEVADRAVDLGRLDLRCAALIWLGNVDKKQARGGDARRRLVEAEQIAMEIGDRRLEIEAVYGLGDVRAWFGDDARVAIEDVRRGTRIAEELNERALRTEGHLRLGFLLFNAGELADCKAELERCLTLTREAGGLRDEARATFLLGLVMYYEGDLAGAERLNLQAREWLERTGETYFKTQNLSRALALYALARNDPRLAEERLQEALALALEGGGWVVAEIYRYLTQALVAQERHDDARELAAFAAQGITGEDKYEHASVLLAAGIAASELETARTSFLEAMELLTEVHQPVELAEARLAFARTLRRLGGVAEARVQLELARQDFLAVGAHGALADIDRELSRVSSGAGTAGPATSI